MLSPVWPAAKIPALWQPLVSREATLSGGETKPRATVSHPASSPRACQGGVTIQNPVVFPLCSALLHHQHLQHPPSSSLELLTHSQAAWLAAADEWGVFSQRCQSVPLGHPEPVRSCGRTPPCLPIYPYTSNSEGPHHRHGLIKLSHYYCYCYLVIAYTPGM